MFYFDPYFGEDFPIWLLFFKCVETANQIIRMMTPKPACFFVKMSKGSNHTPITQRECGGVVLLVDEIPNNHRLDGAKTISTTNLKLVSLPDFWTINSMSSSFWREVLRLFRLEGTWG